MDSFMTDRTRDHLHRFVTLAPAGNGDFIHAAASGREEGGMPVKQAFCAKRFVAIVYGVKHHIDEALDIMVFGKHIAVGDAEPPGDTASD